MLLLTDSLLLSGRLLLQLAAAAAAATAGLCSSPHRAKGKVQEMLQERKSRDQLCTNCFAPSLRNRPPPCSAATHGPAASATSAFLRTALKRHVNSRRRMVAQPGEIRQGMGVVGGPRPPGAARRGQALGITGFVEY